MVWGKFLFYLACRKLDLVFLTCFSQVWKYQGNEWKFTPAMQAKVLLKIQQLIWGVAVNLFFWKEGLKGSTVKGFDMIFWQSLLMFCFMRTFMASNKRFTRCHPNSYLWKNDLLNLWARIYRWLTVKRVNSGVIWLLMDFISWRLFNYAILLFAGELDPNIW